MGQSLQNVRVVCDYATPENETAFELHMALPIPYKDMGRLQTWLSMGDWQSAEQYLKNDIRNIVSCLGNGV